MGLDVLFCRLCSFPDVRNGFSFKSQLALTASDYDSQLTLHNLREGANLTPETCISCGPQEGFPFFYSFFISLCK